MALKQALEDYGKLKRKKNKDWNFYEHLLPKIIDCCLRFEWKELPLMRQGKSQCVKLSAGQVLHILANEFFLNTVSLTERLRREEQRDFGEISFLGLYIGQVDHSVASNRILCQLSYLDQVDLESVKAREVSYERLRLEKPIEWSKCAIKVDVNKVNVHTKSMEESPAKAFVDFANRHIHIHQLIASCTQEEVLFSVAPECFPIMLLAEEIGDSEAFVLRGLKRFSEYTGYLSSFKFKGPLLPNRDLDVIVIDASIGDASNAPHEILRDLNKAFLAFSQFSGQSISTGHWGGGIFRNV